MHCLADFGAEGLAVEPSIGSVVRFVDAAIKALSVVLLLRDSAIGAGVCALLMS